MQDCIFCNIVARTAAASVIYEDASILAFMDIRPAVPGHTLIIPKKHCACLADLDTATSTALFNVTLEITRAVRTSGVKCEGLNLFLADGEAAGQEVFHVHMHVLPRYKGDGFMVRPTYGPNPTREELNNIAARIKSSLPIR